ncbi:hypothetical protein SF12_21295 [Streptomyces sp. MBRL 601]|nr:hypothetical protein SF12_21295 [Streptomyces sp. MBRL 601]
MLGEVGLADDAEEVAVVHHHDPADLGVAHRVEDLGAVGVGGDGHRGVLDEVRQGGAVRGLACGEGADDQVAVGDDADQSAVGALDGEGAYVVVPHDLGGSVDRLLRQDRLDVGGHEGAGVCHRGSLGSGGPVRPGPRVTGGIACGDRGPPIGGPCPVGPGRPGGMASSAGRAVFGRAPLDRAGQRWPQTPAGLDFAGPVTDGPTRRPG